MNPTCEALQLPADTEALVEFLASQDWLSGSITPVAWNDEPAGPE